MKATPPFTRKALWMLALLLAPVSHASAAEVESAPGVESVRPEGEGGAVDEERAVETREQKGGSIGYGFISRERYPGRAAPYSYLHSSAKGGLFYRRLEKESNLELDGAFLNPNDYHGDLLVDYRGDYRLHLRTESLFHNLDRELLFSTGNFAGPSTDRSTGFLMGYGARQDLPDSYGVSVTQDLAQFRYRLHNFPLHVNLGYWRLIREGTLQQRFADVSFERTGRPFSVADPENLVYAQSRRIEQWTEEATFGLDSHLGWVDLVYSFKARQFEDRDPIPTQGYQQRLAGDGTLLLASGVQQHNENPDSRFFSHTVKLHTSVAGGMVGAASYSIEERENLSRLTDTTGVRHSSYAQNAAADLSYTPFRELTVAVKYRRQEVDQESPATVSNLFFTTDTAVRAAMDTVKDQVIATVSYRPSARITVNGEYRGEFLQRENTSAVPTATSWGLPEHSNTSRGALTVLYRPLPGARLSGKYSYAVTDHPSYGNSFSEVHEGQLLASYTSRNRFGGSASFLERRGRNDDIRRFLLAFPLTPATYFETAPLAGDREVLNASLGVWWTPVARVTVSANYAYLSTEASQPVLFTGVVTGSEAGSDFFARSHVYGVNATFAATDKLDLSLMLQQTRSRSAFAPQQVAFSAGSDTTGIRELTEQDTVIDELSTRGEYRFSGTFSASLEYLLRKYDEKNQLYSAYNGTVHAVGAALTARW